MHLVSGLVVLGQLPVLILSNLLLGELTDLVSFRSRGQGDRNIWLTQLFQVGLKLRKVESWSTQQM